MRTVPFLNLKGDVIGEASISANGATAIIKIDKGREAEVLGTSCLPGLSLGYKFAVEKSEAGDFIYASGDAQPLKDDGRRLFVVQAVPPSEKHQKLADFNAMLSSIWADNASLPDAMYMPKEQAATLGVDVSGIPDGSCVRLGKDGSVSVVAEENEQNYGSDGSGGH